MEIEIAELGRMTQSGSSLIRLMQNNHMPVLDLLVRECLQNSLDAGKTDSEFVEVEFCTGKFNSFSLSGEFEKLEEPLNRRFGDDLYDYLAIRDSNTVGLTGVMKYSELKDNNYGNLLKLVYEICKPQNAEGAGGSWGIGKTVYFRIGIGLVIYYSRIKKDDGSFESRLAASFVEDESSSDAMIPKYEEQIRRGIAWWGNSFDTNKTEPVTDENYILNFLKIFSSIRPYDGDETGTTIIIPYISPEQLLQNNHTEYLNNQEQQINPFWMYEIDDYISISVQRWYAPRLNNKYYKQYKNGPYLKTKVNGKGIGMDSIEPVFKVVQALYNRAIGVEEHDILTDVDEKIVKNISLRNVLEDPKAGVLAFARVNSSLLQMTPPTNNPNPFMYFNKEILDSNVNKPIICFTRKPAMIVSYENMGDWADSIPPSQKDEYIIGIFVLNSFSKLKISESDCDVSVRNIEEYIRKSEKSDHAAWCDWSEGHYNPRLVTKIQKQVRNIITKEFSENEQIDSPKINSGFGKLFGDLLLPQKGFGNVSSIDENVEPTGSGQNRSSRFKLSFDATNVSYSGNLMVLPVLLENPSGKKIDKRGFTIFIDSESKKISINQWESEMKLRSPFAIKSYSLVYKNADKEFAHECSGIGKETEFEGISFRGIKSDNGTYIGLEISSDNPICSRMTISVAIELYRRDVKPRFEFF